MLPDFEIWLDNQLSSVIAKYINEEFSYNAKSAYILGIQEATDNAIFEKAKQNANLVILVSKDGDFPKILAQKGIPPKLIKLNIGNLPTQELWLLLKPLLKASVEELLITDAEIIYIEQEQK